MISLKLFAVIVHETFCKASNSCVFLNVFEDEFDEYQSFREIACDAKFLHSYYESDHEWAPLVYGPTQYGIEYLNTHHFNLTKESHE